MLRHLFWLGLAALFIAGRSEGYLSSWGSEQSLSDPVAVRPMNHLLEGFIWPVEPLFESEAWAHSHLLLEREVDFRSKVATTAYKEAGFEGGAGFNCSTNGSTFLGLGAGRSIEENLVTRSDNYAVSLGRGYLGAAFALGSKWDLIGIVVGKGGWRAGRAVYPFEQSCHLEGGALARRIDKKRLLTIATFLDSFIVRDTGLGLSYLMGRENLRLAYERRWEVTSRAAGIEATCRHYDASHGHPDNFEEHVAIWYRMGIPQVERFLFFRYQFDYGKFQRILFPYLSYNHRVIHAGTFTWRCPIGAAGGLQFESTYGWMRTRELNDPGQQTTPQGVIVPAIIWKQSLNLFGLKALYRMCFRYCSLEAGVNYYWDSSTYRAGDVRVEAVF